MANNQIKISKSDFSKIYKQKSISTVPRNLENIDIKLLYKIGLKTRSNE